MNLEIFQFFLNIVEGLVCLDNKVNNRIVNQYINI